MNIKIRNLFILISAIAAVSCTDNNSPAWEVDRYDGDEVVQVYTRLPEYEGTAPIKELRGFRRVHLKKGQSKTVTVPLRREDLRYWSETQKRFIIPEGIPEIMVGASSADIRLKTD